MSRLGRPNKISRKINFVCLICKSRWLDYPSRTKTKKYCSKKCSGVGNSDLVRKRSFGNKWGSMKKITDGFRQKISLAHKGKSRPKISLSKIGSLNPNWKGGISPENKRIRRSARFFQWRNLVFKRDEHTCQQCGKRGGELHPDHIKQFAYYPELRFELSNGRTLCKPCHLKTDTWGFKKHALPEKQI